jgi:probable F420-dependent oxidoreductase
VSQLRVATGILLLPEHNPVIVAKQAASLDALSNGRLALGVGVGWSREEFDALGVPFEQRGARTVEYVSAMREIWARDVASFSGRFVNFDSIRVYPKPLRDRRIPIVFGGNSDAALRRTAANGDGWYGFNLTDVEAVRDHVTRLRDHCSAAGRELDELDIAVAVAQCEPRDLAELSAIGVDELVLVVVPPTDAEETDGWAGDLRARWRSDGRSVK